MNEDKSLLKRLTTSAITALVLFVCLCITTLALVSQIVTVNNNTFHTGKISINLNDGKAVIQKDEFIFEPGMTVKKEFFVQNESTWDVYYRIYMDDVTGGLKDVLEITVLDGDTVLYSGTASNMTKTNVQTANNTLAVNEKKTLTIYFHYPEDKGNDTQNLTLAFNLCADAVQTKNNPNKEF